MASDTFSPILGYLQMGTGNDPNNWGTLANANVFQIFENATFGQLSETVTGGTLDLSTSPPPAAANQVGFGILNFSGGLTSKQTVKIPNITGKWIVFNNTTGAFALQLETATGSSTGTPLTVPQGGTGIQVWCDGNNNLRIVSSGALLSILQFGATADGATDNTAALNAAFAALGAAGGAIYFPAGKYAFANAVTLNLPSTGTPYDLTIFGDGPDASTLFWQAGGGLQVAYNSGGSPSPNNQGTHFRDLAFTTGAAGAGTALTLSQASGNNGSFAAQTEITRCAFRGDTPYVTQAWGNDVNLQDISNVNINGCAFAGPSAGGGGGVLFSGLNASNNAVALNIINSVFNLKAIGLSMGSFAVGTTVSHCQFTNCTAGIQASGSALAQLVASNCQFTLKSNSNGIVTVSALNALQVTNCLFGALANATNTGGVTLSPASNFAISNSLFLATAGAASNIGVSVNNQQSVTGGIVTGCLFAGLAIGINVQSGALNVNIGPNSYIACATNMVNGSPPGNLNQGSWLNSQAAGFGVNIGNTGGVAADHGIAVFAGANAASDSTTIMVDFLSGNGSATVGSITRNGTGVAYNTTSDERLKDGFAPTRYGLDALLGIPVEDFIWVDDPDKAIVQGLVAQRLFPHYPAAVRPGGEDPKKEPWAIDYGRLTPLLIRSVQELADRLSAIEAKPPRRRPPRKRKPRKPS